MKVANIFLTALFALFTVVQFNDPDAWAWIIFYLFITALFGLAVAGKYYKPAVWVGLAACVIGAVFHAVGAYEFLTNKDGIAFSEGMSNAYPYIEKAREFGGLVISFGAMVFLYMQLPKTRS
ncbi:MAG: transmembrane 220 family protein [Bacteroidia bacterium]|nr:transmembrane 220 family protein [Bacteroidia bacterium]